MTSPTDPAVYLIDPEGDLFVRVVEFDYSMHRDAGGNRHIKKEGLMKVKRQVLSDHSDAFRAMLAGSFFEASQSSIEMKEVSVAAAESCWYSVELWFRVLHNNLVDESYSVKIEDIWEAIEFSREWLIHLEKLNSWFKVYWAKLNKGELDIEDLRMLLYPCQELEHKAGFAFVTKRAAHIGIGHFEELNPTRHRHLHLANRVIQQINAVRGSMRKEILKRVFGPLLKFCSTTCDVNEKCLKAYVDAICDTNIWPLEKLTQKSNKDILDSRGFIMWSPEMPKGACYACRSRLDTEHILQTRDKVMQYWDGLCLDCMSGSKTKMGTRDGDYWNHNNLAILLETWDRNCGISHGRNTWYFSFMGRKEVMDFFQREQAARKKR